MTKDPAGETSDQPAAPRFPDPHKIAAERRETLRRDVRRWLVKPRDGSGRWPTPKQIDAAVEPLVEFIERLPPVELPATPRGNVLVVGDKPLINALTNAERALAKAIETAPAEHVRARRQLANLRRTIRLATGADPVEPAAPQGRKRQAPWQHAESGWAFFEPDKPPGERIPVVMAWAAGMHGVLAAAMEEPHLGTGTAPGSVVAHVVAAIINFKSPGAGATAAAVAGFLDDSANRKRK